MFTLRCFFLCLLASLTACSSAPKTVDADALANLLKRSAAKAENDYQNALQAVQDAPEHANYHTLRLAYTRTARYQPFDDTVHEASHAILAAIENGDYLLCLALSQAVVNENFVALYGHFGMSVCSPKAGKDLSGQHRLYLQGLLNSISRSGDGKTPETPLLCISQEELRAYLELQQWLIVDQFTLPIPGKDIEKVLVARMDSEKEETLYFDLSLTLAKTGPGAFAP